MDTNVGNPPEALTAPARDAGSPVVRFELNLEGRDFVVGDIHGMFDHMDALLEEIRFDRSLDRMFSVGDLVDRGPRSRDALAWLAQPWFHACRGNHEQFAIDSEDPEQFALWVYQNGGEWWLDVEEEQRRGFREAFLAMPLAMEVETATGTVGIVHADVPPLLSWDRFMDLLEYRDEDATFYAIWSRSRISGEGVPLPVRGRVERVYCGHTPTRETVEMNNVYYIDTGAVYSLEGYDEARLTAVQIHPPRHEESTILTSAPV